MVVEQVLKKLRERADQQQAQERWSPRLDDRRR